MARNAHAYRSTTVKASVGYAGNKSSKQEMHPFGPQMACEVFGVYYDDYEDYDSPVSAEEGYVIPTDLEGDEYWYQAELPLETLREMEQRHLRQIKRFEQAYRKMCHHAMKWHYLMEDLEDNSQLNKMFNDIQLMRKLGGSEAV